MFFILGREGILFPVPANMFAMVLLYPSILTKTSEIVMTEEPPLVHITSFLHESETPDITGFRFVAYYNGGQARATILVEHVSLDPQQPDTFCDKLRRLADALSEAARYPQGIHWHLPGER